MDINKLSNIYNVKRINNDDILKIYNLCKDNKEYYNFFPPFVSIELIKKDMKLLPPNTSIEDKYYLGYYCNDKLIAVIDLILNYPNKNSVYIGFFMVDKAYQNKGVGKSIIYDVCEYLKKKNYNYIELACVKDNIKSISFWKKIGFMPIGNGEVNNILVSKMKKIL